MAKNSLESTGTMEDPLVNSDDINPVVEPDPKMPVAANDSTGPKELTGVHTNIHTPEEADAIAAKVPESFVNPLTNQVELETGQTEVENPEPGITSLHYLMKADNPDQDILPEDFVKYTIAGVLKDMPEKTSVGTVGPNDHGAIF